MKEDTRYAETLSERLGCKRALKVGDPVRCIKDYHPHDLGRKWSYAEKGFNEGKLGWIQGVEERDGKTYYDVIAEQFEALQPTETEMEESIFKQYFKQTRPIPRNWVECGLSYS